MSKIYEQRRDIQKRKKRNRYIVGIFIMLVAIATWQEASHIKNKFFLLLSSKKKSKNVEIDKDSAKTALNCLASRIQRVQSQKCIQSILDENGKNYCQNTPDFLHSIILEENIDIVLFVLDLLFQKKTNFNALYIDAQGRSLMHCAVIRRSKKIVKKLLKISPELANMRGGHSNYTPLHVHVLLNIDDDLNELKFLVEECGFDATLTDENNELPLHYAAMYDRENLVAYLVKKCDVNTVSKREGFTPIFRAHNIKVFQILLDNGAKINIKDRTNTSLIDYVKKYRDPAVYQILKLKMHPRH